MRTLSGILLLALASAASGQQQPEPAAVKPRHTPPSIVVDTATLEDVAPPEPRRSNCWRAHPMPFCSGYFLTDIGFDYPLYSSRRDSTARRPDIPWRLAWTFGAMGTRGRHSHGAAVSFLAEPDAGVGLPWLVEYRYRNWRGGSAIDAGIGFRRGEVPSKAGPLMAANGTTMMLGYTPNRWIGTNVRAEFLWAEGRTHRAVLAGLQSTRASEFMIRSVFIGAVSALLGSIGIELEE